MSPRMVELHDIDVPSFLQVLDSCEGEEIGRAHV